MPSIALRRVSFPPLKNSPGNCIRKCSRIRQDLTKNRRPRTQHLLGFPGWHTSPSRTRSAVLLWSPMRPLTLGRLLFRCGILAALLFVVVVVALKMGAVQVSLYGLGRDLIRVLLGQS